MGNQHQFYFQDAIHLYAFLTLVHLQYRFLRIPKGKKNNAILMIYFFQSKAVLLTNVDLYKITNSEI